MHRNALSLAVVLAVLLPLAACSGNRRQPDTAAAQLAFGASMAQRGLWQEALFRFSEAERLDPQNPRVHNNLGVAYEAAGNFEQALAHYKRALEIAPNSREAKSNYARFVEFYQNFKGKPGDKKAAAGKGSPGTPASGKPPVPQLPPGPGGVERGAPGAVPPPTPPPPPTVPPRGAPQPPQPPDTGAEPPPPGTPGR